ncbi:MAG: EamA family transporter [Clostridia bacterium]|nr:EamA family transporter [Clostridia bacterium]
MKNKSIQNIFGALLVTVSGILWGSIGIFIRPFSENLTSMQIVTARAVLTTLIMLVFLLIFKRKLLKIKLRDIWCFIGTGLCSIVFFNYCYFRCMNITSLSVAAILLYTAPAIVMLISAVVFREKITVQKISALLLAMLGCALVSGITGAEAQLSTEGILTGLGAGFGYALYSIFSRVALNKGYNSLTITFYTFLVATICLIPVTDWGTMIPVMTVNGKTFITYVLFALTSTVIPYILYTYGLQKLTPAKASIIASVEPVSATIVGFIFFNERPSITAFIAIGCILFSIILLAINKDKK